MMDLVKNARMVFSTETSKKEYDEQLAAPIPEKNIEPEELLQKHQSKIDFFIKTEQWDLAQNEIKDVLTIADTIDLDEASASTLYRQAISISLKNGMLSEALDYSNKVIALFPYKPEGYNTKAGIIDNLIREAYLKGKDPAKLRETLKQTYKIMLVTAQDEGEKQYVVIALGKMAYWTFIEGKYEEAENFALKALEIDPKNEDGRYVIDSFDRKIEVKPDCLYKYWQEKSNYEEKIVTIIGHIISSGVVPDNGEYWSLAKRVYNSEREESYGERDNHIDWEYGLTTKGDFIEIRRSKEERLYIGSGKWDLGDPVEIEKRQVPLSTMMELFDFEVKAYRRLSGGYERTNSIAGLSYFNDSEQEFSRLGCRKGKNLYGKLAEIDNHVNDSQVREAAIRKAEEEKCKAEEEKRKEEAKRKAEEEAKRKAEVEAKCKAQNGKGNKAQKRVAETKRSSETESNVPVSLAVHVGDTVTFGKYPKTVDGRNLPLKWRVLDKKDGKALLITLKGIDLNHYHNENMFVVWKKCTLRSWLNRDFIQKAFSAEERKRIVKSILTEDTNPKFSDRFLKSTKDQVFLLSIAEVKKYFTSAGSRVCQPTNYADQGNKRLLGWWLRSPGGDSYSAAIIEFYGEFGGHFVLSNELVRPALWVSLQP